MRPPIGGQVNYANSAGSAATCTRNSTTATKLSSAKTISLTGDVTGSYSFYSYDGLTSVVIPDSITSIGGSAFWGCRSLTSIVIPDSVISIDFSAFHGCSSLTSVVIGDNITSIGSSVFAGCTKLTDVYYKGNEEQWNAINIGGSNTELTSATIHYNYQG